MGIPCAWSILGHHTPGKKWYVGWKVLFLCCFGWFVSTGRYFHLIARYKSWTSHPWTIQETWQWLIRVCPHNIGDFLDLNNNGKLDLPPIAVKDSEGNVIPQPDSSYVLVSRWTKLRADSLEDFILMWNKISKEKNKAGTYRAWLLFKIKVTRSLMHHYTNAMMK